ncbi:MAG: hypothetical protein ABFD89_06745 [Bryobacteraceae bacterium]
MTRWGRGGMVGVGKAVWKHEQTIRQAEAILSQEHGTRHQPGEHELCPKCREFNSQKATEATKPRA